MKTRRIYWPDVTLVMLLLTMGAFFLLTFFAWRP